MKRVALMSSVVILVLEPALSGQTDTNQCFQLVKSPICYYEHVWPCWGICKNGTLTKKQYPLDRPGRAVTREGCNCTASPGSTFLIRKQMCRFSHVGAEYTYEPWGEVTPGTGYSGTQCSPDGEFVPDGWFDHLL